MATQTLDQVQGRAQTLLSALESVWQQRWLAVLVAAGVAALAGIVTARVLPHGPATAPQVLLVMATSLGVGIAGGLAMRSWWALLLAPAAYILAVEAARLGTAGPTAGAIRLDNLFGILAFVTGRGFHGLAALPPMALGTGLGIMLAARLMAGPAAASAGGLLRWLPGLLLAGVVVAFGVAVMWPASTPPIAGADGKPLPGSITTLEKVRLGNSDQWIMIRGYNAENPVLLYLSGGPGQSDLAYSRIFFDDLSRDFVVVGWDQRGTGKSYAALDPTAALTLEQAISDTIELTNYLRERFGEEKIYLLGESWGSTLGVLAVQRRPDLYHAWIGSGQMVSQRETDRRLYHDVLALAARTGDEALTRQMQAYGEPPYADIPYAYALVMSYYEALYGPYTVPQSYIETGERSNPGPYGILASEYNFVERVNVLRGLIDMFTVMYPQLQQIDFRRDVPRLDVPVYILDGGAELSSRRDLALAWFDQLEAPIKRIYTFDGAAHSVAFEQFQPFHRLMVETVLPETYAN